MKKFEGLMILSDLDGTLLSCDRTISQDNRSAIDYFIREGGRFSVATGRVKLSMEYFLSDLAVNAPAVIHNGAVLYDFARRAPVKVFPVGESGVDLAREAQRRFPQAGIEVALLDEVYVLHESELTRRHLCNVRVNYIVKTEEEIAQPWINLNLMVPQQDMDQVERFLSNAYGDRLFLQRSSPICLEVMAPGSNKGAGAVLAAQQCGIDLNGLYVAGDGLNDVELMASTRHAYAPQNAVESIQKMAEGLLPDNDHGAIAALIDMLDARAGHREDCI